MATQQTASASVPIRVARQNIYATLAFQLTGSLAQAFNGSKCTPDWTQEKNQPSIKPVISVPSSVTVTSVVYTWKRNDKAGGTTDSIGDSTVGAKNYTDLFTIASDGTLTIIGNLASEANTDPDTLTCEVSATIGGQSVVMTRSISCTLLPQSSAGYMVTIDADNTVLSSTATSCKLTAHLWNCDSGTEVSSNDVKWAWENGDGDSKGTTNSITVSRDDVDWEQLYRVEATVDGSVVGVGTVTVQDVADNYKLEISIDGEVSSNQSATVTIALMQRKSDADGWTDFAPSGATYTAKVLDTEDTDVGTLKADAELTDGKATFPVDYDTITGYKVYAGYVNVTAKW